MSGTAEQSTYRGPERRRHRVLVTANSEYHCRDDICVAVRDRRTDRFVGDHPALGKHISGGLRLCGRVRFSGFEIALFFVAFSFLPCQTQLSENVEEKLKVAARPERRTQTRDEREMR